jgi:hypothetical protein
MFVTRSELPSRPMGAEPRTSIGLLLEPLDGTGALVQFETFETSQAALRRGNDVYQRILEITGRWTDQPSHAVFAEWQVGDAVFADAFVESRRQLFELRRHILSTFAVDWLLQRVDDTSRYLVLGLYGDEGGLRLCRDHPEIQRFARDHPASTFEARDVSGLHFFRIRY